MGNSFINHCKTNSCGGLSRAPQCQALSRAGLRVAGNIAINVREVLGTITRYFPLLDDKLAGLASRSRLRTELLKCGCFVAGTLGE